MYTHVLSQNQTLREHVNGEMSETPRITVNRWKSLGHFLLYFRSGYRILSAPVMVDKPERKLGKLHHVQ